MDKARALRDESAICRQLAREIKDPASIEMLLERAIQLESRAAAIEERYPQQAADATLNEPGAWRDLSSQQEAWKGILPSARRPRRGGPRAR